MLEVRSWRLEGGGGRDGKIQAERHGNLETLGGGISRIGNEI
jgi:hypothetical protein